MKYKIPFIKPIFPEVEDLADDYTKIVEANWYTNFGPYEQKFRKELEEYVGQDTVAITFNNATSGLMAAIVSLLGHGDGSKYILVPSFTFIAGAQAIIWCGYKPFFIDIDKKNLQMDYKIAENEIYKNSSIAGILLCNSFGIGNPDIDKWESIAKSTKLPLIIDSAAGFGSKYKDGSLLGSKGDCEIFSFHATKPFAVGEGGAVFTRKPKLASAIKDITNFGFGDNRDAQHLGFNAKMQELNAAIGLLQLRKFNTKLNLRKLAYKDYYEKLKDYKFIFIENAENSSLCFASLICPDNIDRSALVTYLNTIGIQAREYYNPPIHQQKYFREHRQWLSSDLQVTESISNQIISLPIHDEMKLADVEIIKKEIQLYMDQHNA